MKREQAGEEHNSTQIEDNRFRASMDVDGEWFMVDLIGKFNL